MKVWEKLQAELEQTKADFAAYRLAAEEEIRGLKAVADPLAAHLLQANAENARLQSELDEVKAARAQVATRLSRQEFRLSRIAQVLADE